MDIDRQWPLFDDFILEIADGRSRATQAALGRIHRHVTAVLGDDPCVAALSKQWSGLLDPCQLPTSHAMATRYLSTLRRFSARLPGSTWTEALDAAERVVEQRHAQPEVDAWARRPPARLGLQAIEPSTKILT